MRENRPSGSEGGVAFGPSLPLSGGQFACPGKKREAQGVCMEDVLSRRLPHPPLPQRQQAARTPNAAARLCATGQTRRVAFGVRAACCRCACSQTTSMPVDAYSLRDAAHLQSAIAWSFALRYFVRMSLTEVEKPVTGWSDRERGDLAAWLLDSLPAHDGEDASAESLAEAVRRREELDSGKVQPLTDGEFWATYGTDRR